MKALIAAFNLKKALVGAFSMIVKTYPMVRFVCSSNYDTAHTPSPYFIIHAAGHSLVVAVMEQDKLSITLCFIIALQAAMNHYEHTLG